MMGAPGANPGFRTQYPPVQQPEKFERALDFLEQVKAQFQDQPHVYNQFLEIMKDFKTKAYVGSARASGSSSVLFSPLAKRTKEQEEAAEAEEEERERESGVAPLSGSLSLSARGSSLLANEPLLPPASIRQASSLASRSSSMATAT